MSLLITKCPRCNTKFQVFKEQLEVCKGLVRCGNCDKIFNGEEELELKGNISFGGISINSQIDINSKISDSNPEAERKEEAKKRWDEITFKEKLELEAKKGKVELSLIEEAPKPSLFENFAVSDKKADDKEEEKEDKKIDEKDDDELPDFKGEAFGTPSKVNRLAHELLFGDTESTKNALEFENTLSSRQVFEKTQPKKPTKEEEQAMANINLDFLEDVPLIEKVELPDSTKISKSKDPARELRRTRRISSDNVLDFDEDYFYEMVTTDDPEVEEVSLNPVSEEGELSFVEVRRTSNVKEAADNITVEKPVSKPSSPPKKEQAFTKRVKEKQRVDRIVSRAMFFLCPILLIVLLAQVAGIFQSEIVREYPSTRKMFCGMSGCKEEIATDIDDLFVDASELLAPAQNEIAYTLNFLLINQSSKLQKWPSIELTLTNMDNHPVVRREFKFSDFLPKTAAATRGFMPASEQSGKLVFEVDPKIRFSGYKIYLFYPEQKKEIK